MANKKYYWLKLKEDFFEEDSISWIEEQENGKEYCLFYLKLCLKSLKTDGLLIRNVGSILVPYDAKSLAKLTNTDIDTVKVAMDMFTKIGLIQILENGEIFISQLQNMVGSETSKAQLMRNKRSKDKENIKGGNNVTPLLPECYSKEEHCYTETENREQRTEIETEIEIEQEQEQEKEIKKQQHIYVEDVVDNIKIFFPCLNETEIKSITNEFLKKNKDENKDIYYLIEKLILTYDSENLTNRVGYLIRAIQEDYKIHFVTKLDNLIFVWESELDENPNSFIAKKKLDYYKYKKWSK